MATALRDIKMYPGFETDPMVASFVGGMTHSDLAKKFGKNSPKAVEAYLRRRRVDEKKSSAMSLDDIFDCIRDGKTWDDISKIAGVHQAHLTKKIRAAGIDIHEIYQRLRAEGKSGKKWDEDEVCQLYQSGLPSSEIAAMFGYVGDGSIRSVLHKHGLIRADGVHQLSEDAIQADAFVKLRNKAWMEQKYLKEELSSSAIASILKCSDITVQRHIKFHGIEARTAAHYAKRRKLGGLHERVISFLDSVGISHQTGWIYSGKWNGKNRSFEVDEFLPEKRMFIEVQGGHWHGLNKRSRKYRSVRAKMWSDLIKFMCVTRDYPDHTYVMLSEKSIASGDFAKMFGEPKAPLFDKSKWSFHDNLDQKEARLFIETHHYSGLCRPAARFYGLRDERGSLRAAIAVANPSRQTIKLSDGRRPMEISRMAGLNLPKNALSWALAKVCKAEKKLGTVGLVAFSDPSPGSMHSGTVYKASNFKNVGRTNWNYHYIDPKTGKEEHKKTVYNRARKQNASERELAERLGLCKIPEWPKTKWEMILLPEGFVY